MGKRCYCAFLLDAMPSFGGCLADAWKFEARDGTSTSANRVVSAVLPHGGASGNGAAGSAAYQKK